MNKKIFPFMMWSLPLMFFTYQFILRLWPSLLMQQIMAQFQIDATGFGLLASFYYYGYAGMQIPIAILLDRYNPRYIVFACAVICGLSTLIFALTTQWYLALMSRFLIGVGSAAGFLATSKVISMWFPLKDYGRMVGFSFTVGLLGAIYGGKPTNILIETFGRQSVEITIGLISIGIGFINLLFMKSKNSLQNLDSRNDINSKSFLKLIKMPSIWILSLSNLLMVGALEGFADVWGVNYLITAFDITKSDAAGFISYIFIGMLAGGPILSALTKHLGNHLVILLCSIGIVLIFLFLIFGIHFLNNYVLILLLTILGILCCYQVIVFATGSELVPAAMLGLTTSLLNCINMFGGSFFHSTIGRALDWFWSGRMYDGNKCYTIEAYQNALLIIPIAGFIGGLLIFYLKATHKKSNYPHLNNDL
jgi:MFS family permease